MQNDLNEAVRSKFYSVEFVWIPIYFLQYRYWREWSGGENDKYKEQKYDKGQGCWNGPERSTRVIVECGEETELVEATEPAKCEYRFVVRSPAACPDPATITDVHEEL